VEKEKGMEAARRFSCLDAEWDYWKFCAGGLPGFLPQPSPPPAHRETKLNILHPPQQNRKENLETQVGLKENTSGQLKHTNNF
jgi:hypothetical protein